MSPRAPSIRRIARETFGFETLRPGQEEAICAVAGGRDTLAVLPNGAGKSAIYQLAALVIPGPTVVVSPLIALQRHQVNALLDSGIEAAEANSQVGAAARRQAFDDSSPVTWSSCSWRLNSCPTPTSWHWRFSRP